MRKAYTVILTGLLVFILSKTGTAQTLAWARKSGGTDIEQGRSLAVDAQGNVYTTGYFQGTVDFDPGAGTYNLTSAGQADIFVSKLDSSGNFIWAVQLGGSTYDAGFGIAVDVNGYVCLTGRFSGTADFDPGPAVFNLTAPSGYDGFVIKLNTANANLVWVKQFITSFIVDPHSITVDKLGNVITSGRFAGQADFDPGAGTLIFTSQGFFEDAFISKLDASGNHVWARQLVSPVNGYSYAQSVAVDGSGNIYTTGGFSDTIDFDPGPNVFNLVGEYFGDAFVYKLDKAGDFVWAKLLTGNGNDDGMSIALDASSNVYTSGSFNATTDFDPDTGTFNLTSSALGNFDSYISKLDSAGKFIWAKQIAATVGSMVFASSVTSDSSGNVYAIGGLLDSADFDPGPGTYYLSSGGQSDIFISKLDNSGNFAWAVKMGATGSGFALGYDIDLDDAGNIHGTGYFQASSDFDPGAGVLLLTASGSDDVFTLKLRDKDGGDITTGIYENTANNGFSLYPNPTIGPFTIVSEKPFSNTLLNVRDVLGRLVYSNTYSSTGSVSLTLDGGAGIYLIELIDADRRTCFKVMKN